MPHTMRKTLSTTGIVLALSGLIVLAAVWPGLSDEFPLKDGRYVTDPKFCAFNDEQILTELSDSAGLSIRTFENGTINFHYESICRIEDVRIFGSDVIFTSVCSAEGEEFSERKNLVVHSDTAFTDGQITFSRCQSPRSGQRQAPIQTSEPAITELEDVYALQTSLSALGFDPGPEDGLAGSRTMSALNSFLATKGLPQVPHVTQSAFDAVAEAHIELTTGIPFSEFVELGSEAANTEPAAGDEAGRSNQKAKENKQAPSSTRAPLDLGESRSRNLPKQNQANIVSGLEVSQSFISGVNEFRNEAFNSFDTFSDLLSRKITDQNQFSVPNENVYRSLIRTAYPFAGCLSEELRLIGFFNTPMHVWVFFWVNQEFTIVDVDISSGFRPELWTEVSSWTDKMISWEVSSKRAMQLTLFEQFNFFHDHFVECSDLAMNTEILDINEGFNTLSEFGENLDQIRPWQAHIFDHLRSNNGASQDEVHVNFVSDLDKQNVRILSFASEHDPTHIILQKWKFETEPEFLDQLSYRIIEMGDNVGSQ